MSSGEATAEALWYVGPIRAEIRRERLNPLAEGMVRVRALYGAISRGTEALIAAGKVPPGEYERMRGPSMGGSLIDGPGNTSVRSTETLCVGGEPGSRSAAAGTKPT